MSRVCRMIKTALRRAQCNLYQCRKNWYDSLSYRDVYVSDANVDYVSWIKNSTGDAAQIKHPSSKHIVFNYANHVHQHGSYNFNNLGDYMLNISACQAVDPSGASSIVSPNLKHELFVWPDCLQIKNLISSDISVLGNLLLKDMKIEKNELSGKLSPDAVVLAIPNPAVMLAVSNTFTLDHAKVLLGWFDDALKKDQPSKKVNFYIVSATKHRNERVASVLILPINKQYEDVNSMTKVTQIVQEMFIE